MKINYKNIFNIKNKKAFVIGGSGVIGSEVCAALYESGCKVFNLDVKFDRKKNKRIKDIYFDCSKLEHLEIKFSQLIKSKGVPDIFINCSYPKTSDWKNNSFKKININSYKKNIDIHLNSFVWTAKIAANNMKKANVEGSIILLSSIYGLVGQDISIYKDTKMTESMTYSVIKGGINNLTRQMASYYGTSNIRVNSICPGGIKEKNHNKKFVKNYLEKVPLKRFCKPSDVAANVLFLSSKASSYITGTMIIVDGGWTAI
jgi:NAD(P)-dependent dehydrogenase (short-subunit alcohol dehydrogenase family)